MAGDLRSFPEWLQPAFGGGAHSGAGQGWAADKRDFRERPGTGDTEIRGQWAI